MGEYPTSCRVDFAQQFALEAREMEPTLNSADPGKQPDHATRHHRFRPLCPPIPSTFPGATLRGRRVVVSSEK